MKRPMIALAALSALALSSFATSAAALEVGSLASSRVGTAWTLDGANMEAARAKLENPSNFGLAGTVPEAIDVTDVAATLTAGVLAPFDAFFIGYTADGLLSAGELNALRNWVIGGGVAIVTCDDLGHDEVCNFFGRTLGGPATSPATPTPGFEAHPFFAGPFGIASSITLFSNISFLATLGPAGVVAVDAGARPVIAVEGLGAGFVVYLGDVDMISDFTLTPGAAINPAQDNDVFLGNLFAAVVAVSCPAGALCLQGGRFEVRATWETTTDTGVGHPVALTSDSGYFWFFDDANIEVVVKVLAACPVNSRYWVFAAGLTNVAVELEVTDTLTGAKRTYFNPLNTPFQPIQDTNAFATCP